MVRAGAGAGGARQEVGKEKLNAVGIATPQNSMHSGVTSCRIDSKDQNSACP